MLSSDLKEYAITILVQNLHPNHRKKFKPGDSIGLGSGFQGIESRRTGNQEIDGIRPSEVYPRKSRNITGALTHFAYLSMIHQKALLLK